MSEKDITCCFSGHRIIAKEEIPSLCQDLENSIENLILKGVTRFAAGGALGFDTLCAKAVLYLKQKYPEISLLLILPCKDQAKNWRNTERALYEDIKSQSDGVIYTGENYTAGCMHIRNRALVDMSSHIICFLKRNSGGTAYTVNYAKENGLNIINLAENEVQEKIDI